MVLVNRWSQLTGGLNSQVVLVNRWSQLTGGLNSQVILINRWSQLTGNYLQLALTTVSKTLGHIGVCTLTTLGNVVFAVVIVVVGPIHTPYMSVRLYIALIRQSRTHQMCEEVEG